MHFDQLSLLYGELKSFANLVNNQRLSAPQTVPLVAIPSRMAQIVAQETFLLVQQTPIT